jgi:hypothetical protein
LPPAEFARLFALGDHRAVSRRRIERRDSRAAGAQPLGQRSLRIQLDFDFAAEHLPLEQFIFPHVGRDHLADLMRLQQQARAEIRDASVIRDHGEVFRPGAQHRGDQIFRDAAQPEAAHQNGGAVAHTGDCRIRIGYSFVHSRFPKKVYCKSRRIL